MNEKNKNIKIETLKEYLIRKKLALKKKNK